MCSSDLALVGAYRLAGELAAAGGDHQPAFTRYDAALRPLVAARQQIGLNLRLMVPRTEAGRHVRNALVRLPLLKAASAVERRVQARNARPLPEYAPARSGSRQATLAAERTAKHRQDQP